jgi:predicted RNA-binding protein with PUA domain
MYNSVGPRKSSQRTSKRSWKIKKNWEEDAEQKKNVVTQLRIKFATQENKYDKSAITTEISGASRKRTHDSHWK